jgi:HAD superfamily hydrolase (TIGR01662 family)
MSPGEYGTWADWLGVPRHTFSAVFGAVIALGMDYRDVFQYFRPGFSLDAERARRTDAGLLEWFGEDDLYPDVRPCMAALRDMGVWVGVAGNQTSRAGEILRKLDLPADLVATSEDWGASKPDLSFFRALISAAPCEASRIVYVGDRLDNDLKPAKAVGCRPADGVYTTRAVGLYLGASSRYGDSRGLAHDLTGRVAAYCGRGQTAQSADCRAPVV